MRNNERGIECESGRLASATYGRFDTRYQVSRFYDDGDGPVFIYQDASGLLGIVRARSWEDAWSIVEDEILDDADETDPDLIAALQSEDADIPEGYGYRPNGNGHNPWNQSHIYSEDHNGSELRLLTYADMDRDSGHGIALLWESWDEHD
jgi:hypothetical protein